MSGFCRSVGRARFRRSLGRPTVNQVEATPSPADRSALPAAQTGPSPRSRPTPTPEHRHAPTAAKRKHPGHVRCPEGRRRILLVLAKHADVFLTSFLAKDSGRIFGQNRMVRGQSER